MNQHGHVWRLIVLFSLGGCTAPQNPGEKLTRWTQPLVEIQVEPIADTSRAKPRTQQQARPITDPTPPSAGEVPLQRLPPVARSPVTRASLGDSPPAASGVHATLSPAYPTTNPQTYPDPLAGAPAAAAPGSATAALAEATSATKQNGSASLDDPPTPDWYTQSAPSWFEQAAAAGFLRRNQAQQLTSSNRSTPNAMLSELGPTATQPQAALTQEASPADGQTVGEEASPPLGEVTRAGAELPIEDAARPAWASYDSVESGEDWHSPATEAIERLQRRLQTEELTPGERRRLEAIHQTLAALLDTPPAPATDETTVEQRCWADLADALRLSLAPTAMEGDPQACLNAWRRLQAASSALSELASLQLARLTFCQRVDGYGQFNAFDEDVFYPDQEVLLYVEVEHFVSRPTAEGGFETELQGRYVIADRQGRRYAEEEFLIDKQQSRNRRHDYFVPYRLYLPRDIPPGEYTLTLDMRDLKGDKTARASIRLTIAGPNLIGAP